MFKVSASSVVGGGPAYNLGGAVPLDHAAALVATFRSGGGCDVQHCCTTFNLLLRAGFCCVCVPRFRTRVSVFMTLCLPAMHASKHGKPMCKRLKPHVSALFKCIASSTFDRVTVVKHSMKNELLLSQRHRCKCLSMGLLPGSHRLSS